MGESHIRIGDAYMLYDFESYADESIESLEIHCCIFDKDLKMINRLCPNLKKLQLFSPLDSFCVIPPFQHLTELEINWFYGKTWGYFPNLPSLTNLVIITEFEISGDVPPIKNLKITCGKFD